MSAGKGKRKGKETHKKQRDVMKDQPIEFKKDTTLAFDGVTAKEYKAGEAYQPGHAHERLLFKRALENGTAIVAGTKPAATKSNKVRTPRSKK